MTEIGRSRSSYRVEVAAAEPVEITLAWAARTDTGHVRTANEDSYVARAPIFAVADGMGGHAAGDIASSSVVTRLSEIVPDPWVGTESIERALHDAVDDIERGTDGLDRHTGTTVTGVALTIVGGEATWAVFNIGDSRVYRLVGSTLSQVTVDHSIVQELIDVGAISREEAVTHPHSNVITRAVGLTEAPIPDYRLLPVVAGERLLVCSDGLTKELTDHGLHTILSTGAPARATADALVDAALGNGGRDNVTAVVVDVVAVTAHEAAPAAAQFGIR